MGAAGHHVDPFGPAVDGDAGGDTGVAVADARRDPQAVDLVAARADGDLGGVGAAVGACAGGAGGEVVVAAALVVDLRDAAAAAVRAEGVLRRRVGVTALREQADVGGVAPSDTRVTW